MATRTESTAGEQPSDGCDYFYCCHDCCHLSDTYSTGHATRASASRSLVDTYLRLNCAFCHHSCCVAFFPDPCAILLKVIRKSVPYLESMGTRKGATKRTGKSYTIAHTEHIEDVKMLGNLRVRIIRSPSSIQRKSDPRKSILNPQSQ